MPYIITQLDKENFTKQKWDLFSEFYGIQVYFKTGQGFK